MFFYEYQHSPMFVASDENMTFPQHIHSHMEILYMLEGDVCVTNDADTRNITKDEIYFCFPNVLHGYESQNSNRYILCVFDYTLVPYFKNKLLNYNCATPFIKSNPDNEEIRRLLINIKSLKDSNGDMDLISANINLAVAMILNKLTLSKHDGGERYSEWFVNVINYISNNYMQPLTLEDVSKQVSISTYYLSRKFKDYMKCSMTTYVNRLRVGNAVNLLRMTDKNISEISYECGFENIRSFNRAYKQITGETPRQIRKDKR